MLTFHASADPHSLEVKRDGRFIGFLQWHPGRPPHFIQWTGDGCSFTIDEMERIIRHWRRVCR